MNSPERTTISSRTRYRLQSLRDTMYWFREKIEEFRHEFSQDREAIGIM